MSNLITKTMYFLKITMKYTAYGCPDEETLMNHARDLMTRKLRKHYRHKIKKLLKVMRFRHTESFSF